MRRGLKLKMTREEIIKRINKAILVEFDVTEESLKPEAHLGDDLGLDSLDGIDLVVAIEREFKESGVKIKEEQARELITLKTIYDAVESIANASA